MITAVGDAGGVETMKGFRGRDRGHLFDVSFSDRNQSFLLAAL
jgi:hypothetical protein